MRQKIRQFFASFWKNKVAQGALFYSFSSLVISGANFALLPVWVTYLTSEELGIYGLVSAYAGLLLPISVLSIHGCITRERVDVCPASEKWRDFVSTVFWASCLQSVMVCSLFVACVLTFNIGGGDVPVWCIGIGIASAFFGAPLMVLNAVLKAEERHGKSSMLDLSGKVAGFTAALVAVVALSYGAAGRLLVPLVSALVGLGIIFKSDIKKLIKVRFVPKYWKQALIYGLPLLPHGLATVALRWTDRVMIEHYDGLAATGEYTIINGFGLALGIIIYALNSAWIPRYQRIRKEGEEKWGQIVNYNILWLLIVSAGTLVFCALGGYVFNFMTFSKYTSIASLIVPVAAGIYAMGLYMMASASVFYERNTKLIPVITGIGAAVNVLANWWSIPIFGQMGAAISTMLGSLVIFGVSIVVCQGSAKHLFAWGKMVIHTLLFCGLLYVVWYSYVHFSVWKNLGLLVCVILLNFFLVILLFRNEFKNLVNSIKKKETIF